MRIIAVASALALAVALGACGGSSTEVRVAEVGTNGTTNAYGKQGAKARARQSCQALGITALNGPEGACVLRGTRLVAANGHTTLRLKTLTAAIKNLTVAEQIPGKHGPVGARDGAFVLVTLAVKNRDKVAHAFAWGQTVLGIENVNYEENAAVERRSYESAFAFPTRRQIPAGGTVIGDVVYEVPTEPIQRITQQGRVFVANFGERPLVMVARHKGEIGFLRLYQ
jgi:hypothetical protein